MPGRQQTGYFHARKSNAGFFTARNICMIPGLLLPGTRREKRMHTERTQYVATSIPMHSNRLMKLTETVIKLPTKTVRLCIDCVEWIWGYTKIKHQKPITSIRTLEMSPELREACINGMKERGRY
jgi:hypothetical protein